MQLDLRRTIVAVSSPLAAAERAIVRLSGPATIHLLQQVLADSGSPQLTANQTARAIRVGIDLDWFGRTLDATLYLWPTDRSFTGEPSAELHFLGSMPLANKVVQRLLAVGASPAEHGEFSLRAFLAGKLDLVQAEAVLGVIESTQIDQLNWALGQLGGNISQPVRELRAELLELLAHLEAGLDFVEEDIEFISIDQLSDRLIHLRSQVDQLAERLNSRGIGNRDFELALIGFPNAGKSSLFNQLLGAQRTIVSDIAGTTRDVVSSQLVLKDLSLNLIDTAGLEQVHGVSPRALAQSALYDRVQTCDAVLLCVDLSLPLDQEWIDTQTDSITEILHLQNQQLLTIGTKADRRDPATVSIKLDLAVSVFQPNSIEQLRNRIQQLVQSQGQQPFTQATHHTAVRCRHALLHARRGLNAAVEVLQSESGEELVASELHCVLEDLAQIIGEVHNDDILGEIFSRFCIGK